MPDTANSQPIALLVTRNFPPLLGGMENVNQRLLRELATEWQVALCGPKGCGIHAPEAMTVRESAVRPLSCFLIGITFRALAMAWQFRPKLVIAGSGLAAPMAWAAARLSGAKLAVYLHGLDIIAPSRIYQMLWLPFIRASDVVLVNSGHTARLAIERGTSAERVHVLHPGTEIPELDADRGRWFREKFGLAERPVLLSVGRLTRRKGLAEFVTKSLPAILEARPEARLVIIGEEATDALHHHAGSEHSRIVVAAGAAGVESSVMLIGRLSQAELGAAYQAANVHVFPVLEEAGDVEGFGMVALEAAAHGLRTVAFAVGGVPDAIDDSCSGPKVQSGAYADFSDAVLEILQSPQTSAGVAASRGFAIGNDWRHFGLRLRSLLGGHK